MWDLSTGLYPHFEEPSDSFIGNTAEIARSYLLPELLAEGGAEVILEKAVHVEAFPTDRVEETRVLLLLISNNPVGVGYSKFTYMPPSTRMLAPVT